jgi:hypothetical protein
MAAIADLLIAATVAQRDVAVPSPLAGEGTIRSAALLMRRIHHPYA